jgi:hypothetical protein
VLSHDTLGNTIPSEEYLSAWPPPVSPSDGAHAIVPATQWDAALVQAGIGPKVRTRLHRSALWRRFFHLVFSFFIWGGFMVLSTLMLCVLTSVGYIVYQVQEVVTVVVIALTFYVFLYLSLWRTFARSALRFVLWVWSDPNFHHWGGTSAGFVWTKQSIFKLLLTHPAHLCSFLIHSAAHRVVEWIYRRRLTRQPHIHHDPPAPGKPDALPLQNEVGGAPISTAGNVLHSEETLDGFTELPHEKQVMKEKIIMVGITMVILVVFALPCFIIATKYGYYTIVSAIVMASVLGSVALVVGVNAMNRCWRTIKFLILFWYGHASLTVPRKRAIYIASSGKDHKIPIIDAMLNELLVSVLLILILGLIFVSAVCKITHCIFPTRLRIANVCINFFMDVKCV